MNSKFFGMDVQSFDVHPLFALIGLILVCLICALIEWLDERRYERRERESFRRTYGRYCEWGETDLQHDRDHDWYRRSA